MSALALPRVNPRWMARAPLTFFTSLQRKLTDGEFRVLGVILSDTIGAPDPQEWAGGQGKISYWTNLSECMVGRILRSLESKGLIESTRQGKTKLYRPRIENFSSSNLKDRAPRLVVRKPPQKSQQIKSETSKDSSGIETDSCQQVAKSIPGLQYSCESGPDLKVEGPQAVPLGYRSQGPEGTSNQPPWDRRGRLQKFLDENVTRKLGESPSEKLITRTLDILGGAPLEPLFGLIRSKLKKFTGWGLLEHLAREISQKYQTLQLLTDGEDDRARYHLNLHWRSSLEVRRLHADPDTPEPVKRELLMIWPELKDQEVHPLLRWAREMDERMGNDGL